MTLLFSAVVAVVGVLIFYLGITAPMRSMRKIESLSKVVEKDDEEGNKKLPFAILYTLSAIGPMCSSEIAFHLGVKTSRVEDFLFRDAAALRELGRDAVIVRKLISVVGPHGVGDSVLRTRERDLLIFAGPKLPA